MAKLDGSTASTMNQRLALTLETPAAAAAFIKARDEEKERQRKASIPKF